MILLMYLSIFSLSSFSVTNSTSCLSVTYFSPSAGIKFSGFFKTSLKSSWDGLYTVSKVTPFESLSLALL